MYVKYILQSIKQDYILTFRGKIELVIDFTVSYPAVKKRDVRLKQVSYIQ